MTSLWEGYKYNPELLKFNEISHKYTYDGKVLPSVTQLEQNIGITEDLSKKVDQDYLRNCAEFGSKVHFLIEKKLRNEELPRVLPYEVKWFIDHVYPKFQSIVPETRFATPDYCGCCDAYGFMDDGTLFIMDHKTGHIDEFACRTQMTLYYYGLVACGIISGALKVHFFIDNLKGTEEDCSLIEVQPIEDTEIRKMLECSKDGIKYINPFQLLPKDFEDSALRVLYNAPILRDMTAQAKKFNSELKAAMIKNGIVEFRMKAENENCRPQDYKWYLSTSTSTEFAEDQFKNDYPELYEKYTHSTTSTRMLQGWVKE